MRKKIISLLLILLMTAGCLPAAAEEPSGLTWLVSALDIMKGDPDGNFRLYDNVTRAEFTKIAIAASDYRNAVAAGMTVSPFYDVSYSHWAAPYIQLAVSNKLVNGYEDSTFRPENNVTYEEAVTIFLKLLGYTNDDFGSSWPYGQVGLANNLKLTQGVGKNIGDVLTRSDVMNLVYNLLNTKKKGSSEKYISVFDCEIIENVTLIATTWQDPSINGGKIYTSSGTYDIDANFDTSHVGEKGDIVLKNKEDLLYFSPYSQNVQSYSVTGTIGSDMVLDGKILNIDENLTTYYKSQKATYKDLVASAKSGYTLKTYANSAGTVEYAFLYAGGSGSTEIDVNSLEQYIVYSRLDNTVITYKNGTMSELNILDSDTAYKENQKSTFGALKSSLSLGDIIYVRRDLNGEIEYVSIEDGNVQGPITVRGDNWADSFRASSPTVTRDGEKSSLSEIQPYDIAYYAKDLNMVLAYSKKITGIYEKATPNKDLPTSVVVSGVTYELEGVSAFNALSSNGSFKYGDTVTLLIGKTGQIADVVSPSVLDKDIYGYMTASGKKSFTNTNGETYSSNYISLVAPDGSAYELVTKTDYSSYKNSVVKAVYENGTAAVSKLEDSASVSGTVDADGMKIGNFTLAGNVSILDVSTTDSSAVSAYVTVFPQRLDGVQLSSSSVLYAERDAQGRIVSMILKDVTGDMYEYGMITYAKSNLSGNSVSGSYTYDIGGTSTTLNTSNMAYSIRSGQAAKFVLSGGRVESMTNISGVKGTIGKLTETYLETLDGERLKLASDVVVYQVDSYLKYMVLPLSEAVQVTGKSIYAYYDKAEKNGGRVRVVVIGR